MALAFTNNQGEQPPATGSTASFCPTLWQKGLALAAFTHKGTIHVVEFAGALEASSQKRVCSSEISVFGWAGAIRRARRCLRHKGGHDLVYGTSGDSGNGVPEILCAGVAVLELAQVSIHTATEHVWAHIGFHHPQYRSAFLVGDGIKQFINLLRRFRPSANRMCIA